MAQQLAAGFGDAPAHLHGGDRAVRRLTTSTATFSILAIAFAISTSYQVYRSTIMEIPEDAFTPATAAGYAAMLGVSVLVLTRRRCSWWLVSTFVLGLLAYGTFYYFPEVTTARDMGPIDWLEASVFMGMLAVAEFICGLELFGAPRHRERRRDRQRVIGSPHTGVIATGESHMIADTLVQERIRELPTIGERRIYNPVQKDWATIVESSEETGGARTLIEIEVAPGGGTSPHYHTTYDEHFEVLRGSLAVTVDGATRTLGSGERAVAPKGSLHNFRNATDEPTTFLVELRPGSRGFETSLQVSYGLARDGRVASNGAPRNPYHLALLMEWGDMRMPGVLAIAAPLFSLLARRARRKGIDRELEAAYCR